MNICRTQIIYFLLIILAFITAAGCTTTKPHVYIHPNPGLDRIKNIAVMPFENLTKDRKAGEKVRTKFVFGLLMTGAFNVMDISEVDGKLQKAGIQYGTIQSAVSARRAGERKDTSVQISKRIGDALNVKAIFVGSVETYNMERVAGQIIPEVSISARLIDSETGITIWASTHTRRGEGIPILGWGKVTSLSVLSQQVVQEMVNSLAQHAR